MPAVKSVDSNSRLLDLACHELRQHATASFETVLSARKAEIESRKSTGRSLVYAVNNAEWQLQQARGVAESTEWPQS